MFTPAVDIAAYSVDVFMAAAFYMSLQSYLTRGGVLRTYMGLFACRRPDDVSAHSTPPALTTKPASSNPSGSSGGSMELTESTVPPTSGVKKSKGNTEDNDEPHKESLKMVTPVDTMVDDDDDGEDGGDS